LNPYFASEIVGDLLSFSWVSSNLLDGGEGGGEDWGRGVLMLDARPPRME